jgi:hypothetical protein
MFVASTVKGFVGKLKVGTAKAAALFVAEVELIR